MSSTDFNNEFLVENYACNVGIRVVLAQENHHISYYSCILMRKMLATSTYVKEMFVISQVVGKS